MNVRNRKNFKKDDLVIAYLNDIKGSKSKPISSEEEKELLAKYYAEDTTEAEKTEIRNKIVMSHQRFLYDMANCYANGDNNMLLELINVGTIGMYETFDNFDITKDNKFMTYAQYYVRRAIKHFMDDESLMVRPANNAKITPKVKRIEDEFYRREGRKPTIFEVEDILFEKYGIILANRNDIYGATIERLEDAVDCSDNNQNDSFTLEKSKDFTDYASTENDYEVETRKNDTAYEISKAISKLPEREAQIIRMAYGMGDYNKPCNNIEIGEALGLTSERVRQLRKDAETKLKSLLEKINVRRFIVILFMVLTMAISGCSCKSNHEKTYIDIEPSHCVVLRINTELGRKTIRRYTCDIEGEPWYVYYAKDHGIVQMEKIAPPTNDNPKDKSEHYFDF